MRQSGKTDGHAKPTWLILLMVVTVLVVFGQVVTYDFLSYDDDLHVSDNPYLQKPLAGIPHFWQREYKGIYMPMTYTCWALQAQLAQTISANDKISPGIFHLANLVTHLAAMLVVFAILRLLVEDSEAAAIGAMLFALHPLQVEAVAWISAYKSLLGGLFSLTALWLYLIYAKNSQAGKAKPIGYFIATLSYILALLSQPGAVILPLVAGIIDWRVLRRSWRQVVTSLALWMVCALPIALIGKLSQPDTALGYIPGLRQRILIAGDAVTFYLGKLLAPIALGADYGRTPKMVMNSDYTWITGLFPYIVLIILLAKKRRSLVLVVFALFIASLLPVLGLVPFFFQIISTVADRYVYLAMLAPSLGVAFLLSRHHSHRNRLFSAIVLLILAGASAWQARYWGNSEVLYRRTLAVNPGSCLAHNNLGVVLQNQGKLAQAFKHHLQTIQIDPKYMYGYNNLGQVMERSGRYQEAIDFYRRALQSQPLFMPARSNLAFVLEKQGKLRQAIRQYAKLLEIDPQRKDDRRRMLLLQNKLQKLEQAITDCRQQLQERPDDAEIHNNLGVALERLGKPEEAIEHYRRAITLQPDYVAAYYNLAVLLQKQKNWQQAIVYYRRIVDRYPQPERIYNNMGVIYENRGQITAAIACYRRALEIAPDLTHARHNLNRASHKLKSGTGE